MTNRSNSIIGVLDGANGIFKNVVNIGEGAIIDSVGVYRDTIREIMIILLGSLIDAKKLTLTLKVFQDMIESWDKKEIS